MIFKFDFFKFYDIIYICKIKKRKGIMNDDFLLVRFVLAASIVVISFLLIPLILLSIWIENIRTYLKNKKESK